MTEKIQYIPARLKNASVNGHVAGADDIMDDDLQLTQKQINAIVLGDAVSVAFNFSSSAVDVTTQGEGNATVNLTATCSTEANTIKIKKDGAVVASGSGTSLTHSDTRAHSGNATHYVAEFMIGGLTKTATRNIATLYYGSGSVHTDAKKAIDKVSPAGTYNVTVPANEKYVFFVVPAGMTINRATMSGFDFPLEAPTDVTIDEVAYKSYRSSNTYDAGTLTIVIS
jgi:hypothetical protein